MLHIPFAASFIPSGVLPDARLLLWARGLRAFSDGYVSLLLPYYLILLGYSALEINYALYRRLSPQLEPHDEAPSAPLGKSKRMVYTLAAVFSLDAFGGGFAVQSLLALWLFQRFELSIVTAGAIFFWTGILSAFSQLAAARLARRIGLVNTMWCSRICRRTCC